ncbi:MAG TPA: cation:proton antiporter, partial [Thiotrichales bacterium]|nr:cation:proton antiporter [Thiotrichales bacterium]
MGFENIIAELVLVFAGAALFATAFLYLKQPIILAYIALGMLSGPWGLGIIREPEHIEQLSHVGVILLLFLLGMNLKPERLYHLFSKTAVVTLLTSMVFLLVTMCVALLSGMGVIESLVIGASLMFSSTIVSLKLIPTTTLHHKHTGEMMTSVLLMQDVIAILIILMMTGGQHDEVLMAVVTLLLKLVALAVVAYAVVRFVINRLFMKFDTIREYAFLLSLGWGLLGAGVAQYAGLSYEMGAFIAGVAFASSPVAMIIAEDLKPLRDFFLILFFFSIGAQFNFLVSQDVLLTGMYLALTIIILKPFVFKKGFELIGESRKLSTELGIRLGQGSEFSLLLAYSAVTAGLIDLYTSYLIQMVVIISFVLSTYWVVFRYRTPISSTEG